MYTPEVYEEYIPLFFPHYNNYSSIGCTQPQSVEGNVDNLPFHEYELVIDEEPVNFTDKEVMAMTINGGIPGWITYKPR